MELFVDNARKATIVDEVKLPTSAARAVRAYAKLRKKAAEASGAGCAAADVGTIAAMSR